MPDQYGNFQFEIYLQGLGGVIPELPMTFAELEARAQQAMSPSLWSYVYGGCGDESTQVANVDAFRHWGLMPRMLVDAPERDLSIELFGRRWATPIFMAPIGVTGICTRDRHGDLAVARAAARTKVPMCISTLTMDPMEDIAAEFGDTPGFFQLYTPKDRELAESFVHRAEAAGYAAIVVTLDTWVPGWRPRDLTTANFPQLRGNCLSNYISDPVFKSKATADISADPRAAVPQWSATFGYQVTWNDLAWLRSLTSLPLVLKGICHPDDARRAVDAGVQPAHDVRPARGQPVGHPLALRGQEAGLVAVAPPVLQVGLGVRDVPVAAHHGVTATGHQFGQPHLGRGQETFLLDLPLGVRFPGRHVDAGHRHRFTVDAQIDLQVAAVVGELVVAATGADVGERDAGEHRHPVAALARRRRVRQVPAVVQRRGQGPGQLVVVGAGFLQADHVGAGGRQPGQQAEILGGTLLHRGANSVDVDGCDDHDR